MPFSLTRSPLVLVSALLVATLASPACRSGASDAELACESLTSARSDLETALVELEAMPRALPADAVRYAPQTEAELVRFAAALEQISVEIDTMHDDYEVSCKWALIEEGDFEGVFETVYEPHITMVTRQIKATRAMAERLREVGPAEVVGEAVQSYHLLADQMANALSAQVSVCEADFDEAHCDRFMIAISDALAPPKAKVIAPQNLDAPQNLGEDAADAADATPSGDAPATATP